MRPGDYPFGMSIFVAHTFTPAQSPGVRKAGILCPVAAVGLYALLPLVADAQTLAPLGMYATTTKGGGLALSGTDMYTGLGFLAALFIGGAVFCLLLASSFATFYSQQEIVPEDVWGPDASPTAGRDAARAAHAADMEAVAAEQQDNQPLPGNTFPAPPA